MSRTESESTHRRFVDDKTIEKVRQQRLKEQRAEERKQLAIERQSKAADQKGKSTKTPRRALGQSRPNQFLKIRSDPEGRWPTDILVRRSPREAFIGSNQLEPNVGSTFRPARSTSGSPIEQRGSPHRIRLEKLKSEQKVRG